MRPQSTFSITTTVTVDASRFWNLTVHLYDCCPGIPPAQYYAYRVYSIVEQYVQYVQYV